MTDSDSPTACTLLLAASLLCACEHNSAHVPIDAPVGIDGSPPSAFCEQFAGAVDIPFVGQQVAGSSDTFLAQPCAPGDAVLIHLGCSSSLPVDSVSLSAPGLSFFQLGAVVGSASSGTWAASFALITPVTLQDQTVTVSWNPAVCSHIWEVGDELPNTDSNGGMTTFDAHIEVSGVGDCAGAVTTGHDNDLIWGACSSSTELVGTGAGYLLGTSDGFWHWSEYRVSHDPVGTIENVAFNNSPGQSFVLTAVTVKTK